MKILIAPDSFKGSLSARDISAAMRLGVLRVVPDAEIVEIPLADGGEGTLDSLILATGGRTVTHTVRGPLGDPVSASYGVLGGTGTAVIELAQASGLPLVPPARRDPRLTTTHGTGELIRHALDAGHRDFLIGLGGSATNDGGTGLLRALGMRFLDADGRPLPDGGAALHHLASLDTTGFDPRIAMSRFRIASDVTNPLLGANGASHIFGPQKGATPAVAAELDAALAHYARVVQLHTSLDISALSGGGAAGGVGAALLAFFPARLESGIDVLLDAARFDHALQGADLVLTGEGRLDAQTLMGKTISGVCRRAATRHIPVVALCGSFDLTAADLDALGLLAAFPLAPGPCDLDTAIRLTAPWAADRTEQILRLFTGIPK